MASELPAILSLTRFFHHLPSSVPSVTSFRELANRVALHSRADPITEIAARYLRRAICTTIARVEWETNYEESKKKRKKGRNNVVT